MIQILTIIRGENQRNNTNWRNKKKQKYKHRKMNDL